MIVSSPSPARFSARFTSPTPASIALTIPQNVRLRQLAIFAHCGSSKYSRGAWSGS
jgi:hypothetical protein